MIWVTIILEILKIFGPSIIDMLKEIFEGLHKAPAKARLEHEREFHGILAHWHAHRDDAKLEADLKALHAKL